MPIFVIEFFWQWRKFHEPHLISFKSLNVSFFLAFKFLDNRHRRRGLEMRSLAIAC